MGHRSLRQRFAYVVYYMAGSSTAKSLPNCTRTAILVYVVFKVRDFTRKISKVLHGVEITVIKLASLEDCTITGIYYSPKVPVRHLCEANPITKVLNNILPNRTTISLLET